MSTKAAQMILKAVKKQPRIVLGLATGNTPKRTYELLIEDHVRNHTSYQGVTTFNLDEYIGLQKENKNSYYSYMRKNLFNYLDMKEENNYIPNGMAKDLEAECQRYEELIQKAGGIDLQLLGIGENGHIGFNEPYTDFSSLTHVVELADSTKRANAKYFSDPEEIPTHAISMGIKTIMNTKQIILLAAGLKKAKAMYELVYGRISNKVPATILRNHPDVTVIVDQEAFTICEKKKGKEYHALHNPLYLFIYH
jgi:glucosamine-6-phosphate deaminase